MPPPPYLPHYLSQVIHNLSFTHIPARTDPQTDTRRDTHTRVCDVWIDTPTVFITRYEYGNLYHTITDWYNTYQLIRTHLYTHRQTNTHTNTHIPTHTNTSDVQIVFLDGHSQGAMDEPWLRLFGGTRTTHTDPHTHTHTHTYSHPYIYIKQIKSRTCYRTALFVSPGYRSPLSVDLMKGWTLGCTPNLYVQDFAAFFLRAYDINTHTQTQTHTQSHTQSHEQQQRPERDIYTQTHTQQAQQPRDINTHTYTHTLNITLILRNDYLAHPRIGNKRTARQISNAKALIHSLRTSSSIELQSFTHIYARTVSLERLSFREQLCIMRTSHIVIGIHGAGLTHVLFMRPHTGILELKPPKFGPRKHFQYLSKWVNVQYASVRISRAPNHYSYEVRLTDIISELNALIKSVSSAYSISHSLSLSLSLYEQNHPHLCPHPHIFLTTSRK